MSERRLAAIMFTDMAGYTTLANANEPKAMQVLFEHNRILRPIFTKHNGREIKSIGDSFLVEFDSAQEATECAIEIQQVLYKYNSGLSDAFSRINLRIGIHLGDVVHRDRDVFGDAVNIASRIEPLAEPGGVCISAQVFDQVRNKINLRMIKLEKNELKHVAFPIDIYKIVFEQEEDRTDVTLAIPEEQFKRRLAVLPLVNMSPDPNDAFFADGLTEELITELSLIKDLRVIARTSTMHYKNTEKSIQQVGKELNVGCVLEGSVRKIANRIRVTVQLIDSRSEEHLWAERYDRQLDDVFAIQSEIAANVAKNLPLHLSTAKIKRKQPTDNLDAYTLYLKGRSLWNTRIEANVKDALNYFEKAVALDPDFAQAYSGIADAYSILVDLDQMDARDGHKKGRDAVTKALRLDDNVAEAHASLGSILMNELEYKQAQAEFLKAIELNPSYATAHHWYGLLLMDLGKPKEGFAEMRRAQEADPLSAPIAVNVGGFYWFEGNDRLAQEWLEKANEIERGYVPGYFIRSMFYAAKGMREKALENLRLGQTIAGQTDSTGVISTTGYIYALLGMNSEANRSLDALIEKQKKSHVDPSEIAVIYAGLKKYDEFFQCAFRSIEEKSLRIGIYRISPLFADIRADPRFTELLKAAGVPS